MRPLTITLMTYIKPPHNALIDSTALRRQRNDEAVAAGIWSTQIVKRLPHRLCNLQAAEQPPHHSVRHLRSSPSVGAPGPCGPRVSFSSECSANVCCTTACGRTVTV